MSGHSKWAQIKRKKEVVDRKKGVIFGRISREILAAAKDGVDPDRNTGLRDAIARARAANMPQDNIDRLLNRASNKQMKEATYEAFGPGGIALLLFVTTDNSNRTVQEIRSILKEHGGSLASPGAASWRFKNGQAVAPQTLSKENAEKLQALLTDLQEHPDIADITTDAVE
jgi:YebC/PmpR family DNA-binding regulatory protein